MACSFETWALPGVTECVPAVELCCLLFFFVDANRYMRRMSEPMRIGIGGIGGVAVKSSF